MPVIAFNFEKMSVERKGPAKGKVSIKNNVTIKSVEAADLNIGSKKEKVLRFAFEFSTEYKPAIGSISFRGDLIYTGNAAKQDEILKSWKKDKQIPEAPRRHVLNYVLSKCSLQALILSRDAGLQSPIPLPKVQS